MKEERIVPLERTRIEALSEEARPLVEKYAAVVAKRFWRIPSPRLDFTLDPREKSEWEANNEPVSRAMVETLSAYFHRENRLAINLTEFQESTARAASQLKDHGFEKVDPWLLNSLIVLAHEGVVHKSCQERHVFGKSHEFLFSFAEAFLEEARMSSVVEHLDEKEGTIFLRGCTINYQLTDGSFLNWGEMTDESFVTVLTSEVVVPCLINLYSLSSNEAILVYTIAADPLPSPDSVGAATNFYRPQQEIAAPLFFSGEFLDQFVLNFKDEDQQLKALLCLATGETAEFFQTISTH